METVLSINKEAVLREVSQLSHYVGAKMAENTEGGGIQSSYDRISIVDEDNPLLNRFWDESKNIVCDRLKRWLKSEEESTSTYYLTLDLSEHFSTPLLPSLERSLFSFFVNSIISKWFMITNKGEAAAYAEGASSHLEDIFKKVFWRPCPHSRPMQPF